MDVIAMIVVPVAIMVKLHAPLLYTTLMTAVVPMIVLVPLVRLDGSFVNVSTMLMMIVAVMVVIKVIPMPFRNVSAAFAMLMAVSAVVRLVMGGCEAGGSY